jgi:rubrerythrin
MENSMTNKNDRIKGTKTGQNLINAFAGESQARNRYTFFSKAAQKEGYEQIAAIFLETAENEKEHAKLFYNYIGNTMGHVNAAYPFELGTTAENLLSAAKGEHEEWEHIYYDGAETAKTEGFDDIANTFNYIISIEKHHESRYLTLLENVEKGTVFQKDAELDWVCRKCGFIAHGKSAPMACPNCRHPQAWFQVLYEMF